MNPRTPNSLRVPEWQRTKQMMRTSLEVQANLVKAGLAGVALMLTAIFAAVPAAKLDDQTCTQLKSEIVLLEGLGVRENIARGAAWGKTNLDRNKLEQVKKLIEMDEAVAFRCPRPKPAPAVADPDAAPVVPAKGKGKAVAKVKPSEVQPRPKPKPKPPAQSSDGAGETGQSAQQQGQPKPRPRPAQPKPAEPKPAQ